MTAEKRLSRYINHLQIHVYANSHSCTLRHRQQPAAVLLLLQSYAIACYRKKLKKIGFEKYFKKSNSFNQVLTLNENFQNLTQNQTKNSRSNTFFSESQLKGISGQSKSIRLAILKGYAARFSKTESFEQLHFKILEFRLFKSFQTIFCLFFAFFIIASCKTDAKFILP